MFLFDLECLAPLNYRNNNLLYLAPNKSLHRHHIYINEQATLLPCRYYVPIANAGLPPP